MEKSLKLFLSLLLYIGCNEGTFLSKEEKMALADEKWKTIFEQTIDENILSQGSVEIMNLLEEIIKLNPNHFDALRERSIPYLKRGMPQEWNRYFDQAVLCDSIT